MNTNDKEKLGKVVLILCSIIKTVIMLYFLSKLISGNIKNAHEFNISYLKMWIGVFIFEYIELGVKKFLLKTEYRKNIIYLIMYIVFIFIFST